MSPMPETAILKCLYQKNNRKDTDMGQKKGSKDSRKGKHLIREEPIVIEVMLKNRHSKSEIAKYLGRSTRCIQREVKFLFLAHYQSL